MHAGDNPDRYLTASQRLLLQAVCTAPGGSASAFAEWNAGTDWNDHFDAGTYPLLPALHKAVEALGIDGPCTGRLKGLYRRSWYRNQRFLNVCSTVASGLRRQGIDVMLTGPAALAAGYYSHRGSRYLEGIDLAVEPKHARAAVEYLERAGWRGDSQQDADFRFRCSLLLTREGDERITLHWYPTGQSTEAAARWFRAGSTPAGGSDPVLLLPAPGPMLIAVLAHRYDYEPDCTSLFVADFTAVLKHPDLDGRELCMQAARHKLTQRLLATLGWVNRELGIPVPAVTRSGRGSGSLVERLERRLYVERHRRRQRVSSPVIRAMSFYLRHVNGLPFMQALTSLPAFLRHHYATNSIPAIACRLVVNGVRRVLRVVARTGHRGSLYVRRGRSVE